MGEPAPSCAERGDIERVMAAMRQLGVRTPGGAEALAILQQLLFDLLEEGGMTRPLARGKVDEKNGFGMLEWPAVRQASLQTLPKHYPVACWKHAAASAVEQRGVDEMPKACPYTHLTLPTIYPVENSGVAVSIKNKRKTVSR